ncbi:predicted protein [Postia placenta Mad-698-R]|nr:predicted protein [Postia placenta Mad-698-R]
MSALGDAEYLQQMWVLPCVRELLVFGSGTAVYTYELVITIDQQVRFFVRRRFSAAVVLYTSMHVSAIIFLLSWLFGWVLQDCHSVFIGNLLMLIMDAVLRLVFGVVSGFRVYAINGRKLLLPFVIAVLYVPDIVEWTASLQTYTKDPVIGCVISYNLSKDVEDKLTAFTQTCIIVSELLVVVAIWRVTYGIRKVTMMAQSRLTVTTLLIRDGSMYFVLLDIIVVYRTVRLSFNLQRRTAYTTTAQFFPWIGSITTTITTILISRMFLNLSSVYYPSTELMSATATRHPTDTMDFGSSERPTDAFSTDAEILSDVVLDGGIGTDGYVLELHGMTSSGKSYGPSESNETGHNSIFMRASFYAILVYSFKRNTGRGLVFRSPSMLARRVISLLICALCDTFVGKREQKRWLTICLFGACTRWFKLVAKWVRRSHGSVRSGSLSTVFCLLAPAFGVHVFPEMFSASSHTSVLYPLDLPQYDPSAHSHADHSLPDPRVHGVPHGMVHSFRVDPVLTISDGYALDVDADMDAGDTQPSNDAHIGTSADTNQRKAPGASVITPVPYGEGMVEVVWSLRSVNEDEPAKDEDDHDAMDKQQEPDIAQDPGGTQVVEQASTATTIVEEASPVSAPGDVPASTSEASNTSLLPPRMRGRVSEAHTERRESTRLRQKREAPTPPAPVPGREKRKAPSRDQNADPARRDGVCEEEGAEEGAEKDTEKERDRKRMRRAPLSSRKNTGASGSTDDGLDDTLSQESDIVRGGENAQESTNDARTHAYMHRVLEPTPTAPRPHSFAIHPAYPTREAGSSSPAHAGVSWQGRRIPRLLLRTPDTLNAGLGQPSLAPATTQPYIHGPQRSLSFPRPQSTPNMRIHHPSYGAPASSAGAHGTPEAQLQSVQVPGTRLFRLNPAIVRSPSGFGFSRPLPADAITPVPAQMRWDAQEPASSEAWPSSGPPGIGVTQRRFPTPSPGMIQGSAPAQSLDPVSPSEPIYARPQTLISTPTPRSMLSSSANIPTSSAGQMPVPIPVQTPMRPRLRIQTPVHGPAHTSPLPLHHPPQQGAQDPLQETLPAPVRRSVPTHTPAPHPHAMPPPMHVHTQPAWSMPMRTSSFGHPAAVPQYARPMPTPTPAPRTAGSDPGQPTGPCSVPPTPMPAIRPLPALTPEAGPVPLPCYWPPPGSVPYPYYPAHLAPPPPHYAAQQMAPRPGSEPGWESTFRALRQSGGRRAPPVRRRRQAVATVNAAVAEPRSEDERAGGENASQRDAEERVNSDAGRPGSAPSEGAYGNNIFVGSAQIEAAYHFDRHPEFGYMPAMAGYWPGLPIGADPKGVLHCPFCPRTFQLPNGLAIHLKWHWGDTRLEWRRGISKTGKTISRALEDAEARKRASEAREQEEAPELCGAQPSGAAIDSADEQDLDVVMQCPSLPANYPSVPLSANTYATSTSFVMPVIALATPRAGFGFPFASPVLRAGDAFTGPFLPPIQPVGDAFEFNFGEPAYDTHERDSSGSLFGGEDDLDWSPAVSIRGDRDREPSWSERLFGPAGGDYNENEDERNINMTPADEDRQPSPVGSVATDNDSGLSPLADFASLQLLPEH